MIYVHVPFCHRKCTYCAFYSTPSARLREAYVDAVLHELELCKYEIVKPVRTVYFGGGTPSLLSADDFSAIADALRQTFDLSALEEFTVEEEVYATGQRPDQIHLAGDVLADLVFTLQLRGRHQ